MNTAQIAAKISLFGQIYIPYPPHIEFHQRCEYLIELGRATRGRPQKGMRVLAPSGSGKSTATEAFIQKFEVQTPRTDKRVPLVYIPLEEGTTSKKLMSSILDFFGDQYSAYGNEQVLKNRVKACFERFGTDLLFVDEAQHLDFRNSGATNATDSLKRFLDDGVVPIVFLGIEEAENFFTKNIQLGSRLIAPSDFKPLDVRDRSHRSLLAGYAASLDRAIVQRGILPELGALQDRWAVKCLHSATDGIIGRVSRLLEIALEIALRRGATRIERYDLASAVDSWGILNGVMKSNPFLREEGS